MNAWQTLLERPGKGNHIAQVYQDEDFLIEALSHFVGSGLAQGDGVVVFATSRHWEVCLRRLGAHLAAPQDAELRGQLVVMDARTALSRFMVDGMPDWKEFQDLVGMVINLTRRRYPRIRVFGEMVDLLWQRGERSAGLRLEALWNHLIKVQDLTLCCAYRMDAFDESNYHGALQQVCGLHSHLVPAGDDRGFEDTVNRASESLVGPHISKLLRSLSLARRPAAPDMPDAQSTMLWMKEYMPITAGKVLSRVRAQRRRRSVPATADVR